MLFANLPLRFKFNALAASKPILDLSRLRNAVVANDFAGKLWNQFGELPDREDPEVIRNFFKTTKMSNAGDRLGVR